MKNIRIEAKWAGYFVLMTLGWMFLERIVGLHDTHIDKHPIYTNLIAIPAVALYVFALLDKRKNHYQGKMTYLQGLKTGIILTIMIALISPLSQFIISTVITPMYFENAIEYSVNTGKMTREAAEASFNLRNYMVQSAIGALIMGVLTSLIVSIFVKKT